MKQVLQDLRSGNTYLEDVPVPAPGRKNVLIETSNTLISAGTERMLVEFGKGNFIQKAKSQPEKVKQVLDKIKTDGLKPTVENVFARLGEPMPLGYCNSGFVRELGAETTGFEIGDRVASNGSHAEFVSAGQNLCAKIPNNVSDEEAAFTVIGSIALQGVRLLEPALGGTYFVMGLGLIGLITVQILKANGCRVIGSDFSPQRIELAKQFGCETVDLASGGDPISAGMAFTDGMGIDGVAITASTKSNDPVHQAAQMSRKRGKIVLVGVVGLELNRSDFYDKELTFQVSCSYGPGRYDPRYEQEGVDYPRGYVRWTEKRNFEAVLQLMSEGKLDVKPLITHRFKLNEVAEAYQLLSGDSSALGILLEYEQAKTQAEVEKKFSRRISFSSPPEKACRAGIIGAGNFAKIVFLPALSKTGAALVSIAVDSGPAGTYAAKKFNISRSVTDLEDIFDADDVNTVFILTQHDTHARFTGRAIEAGKHVYVEKPLAVDMDGLSYVYEAARRRTETSRSGSDKLNQQIMVGFNRRFSPHIRKIRDLVKSRSGPVCMHFTVNAGAIPADSWVHDRKKGGGRIIGEGCHFIDTIRYIIGCPISTVYSQQVDHAADGIQEDKMTIQLKFEDGSIGTVHYWANGPKSYIKEQTLLFVDGKIIEMKNFRETVGWGFKGFKKFNTSNTIKGHQIEIREFCDRIKSGGGNLIPFDEIVEATLASFAAVESAIDGKVHSMKEWHDKIENWNSDK